MEQQEKTEQALSAKKVKEMKKAEKRKQKEYYQIKNLQKILQKFYAKRKLRHCRSFLQKL